MKNKKIWSTVFTFHFLLPCSLLAQGIEIQSGATLETSGNPTIEITDGNLVNNGTFTRSGEDIIFSGTSAGTISGNSNSNVYILTINNTSGVTLGGSENLTINKTLVLTNGIINTGSNILIIGDSATISGAGTTKYINGNCRKTGSQAFTFPVGNNGKYAPITISAPGQATDQFTASFTKGNPNSSYNTASLGSGLDHVSSCEYWAVERTNGASNVAVTLSWDTGSCGVTDLNELNVARWDGSKWVDAGNAGTTGNAQAGTIASNTQSGFGPFILASSTSHNPLPIGLLFFTANKLGQMVQLHWSTSTEVNNDYFTMEKSTDLLSWEILGYLKGAGNSTHQNNYEYTGTDHYVGIQYFRLKQTDYNGKYSYSEIKPVNFNVTDRPEISLYPSPADERITIDLKGIRTEPVTIRILTMEGRSVTGNFDMTGNTSVLDISSLTNGMYFVEVCYGATISRLKLVKN